MTAGFPIRGGVNAVVVSDGRVLVVEFDDDSGHHYNLPGGGVEPDEPVREALSMEVREETSVDITVGRLRTVHGYYPPDHDGKYGPTHKLTLFFEADLPESTRPTMPANPDPHQVGVEWLQIEGIDSKPLYPDLGGEWKNVLSGDATGRFLERG